MDIFGNGRVDRKWLRHINSLTKYPSIDTYHALDSKTGCLTEKPTVFPTGTVIATEKVDGVNARIILLPDESYLLGSREELFYAKGDLVGNMGLGIVENLESVAEKMTPSDGDRIVCYYVELYGGTNGNAARQYTSDKTKFGYRVFDATVTTGLGEKLSWSIEEVASWRQHGGQYFVGEDRLQEMVAEHTPMEIVPRLFAIDSENMPTTVDEMHYFLKGAIPHTRVGLDGAEVTGKSEGIVFRSAHREVIAKARFQDYERTVRKRN